MIRSLVVHGYDPTGEGFTVLHYVRLQYDVDKSQKVTTEGYLSGSVLKSVWIGGLLIWSCVTYTMGMIAFCSISDSIKRPIKRVPRSHASACERNVSVRKYLAVYHSGAMQDWMSRCDVLPSLPGNLGPRVKDISNSARTYMFDSARRSFLYFSSSLPHWSKSLSLVLYTCLATERLSSYSIIYHYTMSLEVWQANVEGWFMVFISSAACVVGGKFDR